MKGNRNISVRAMLTELRRRKREGHRYVQVTVQRRSAPRNWDRVRVFPGVYGRCIGEMDQKRWYLFDVPLDEMLAYVTSQQSSDAETDK